MRLILVRHGETPYNEGGRVQGIGDTELNEKGRTQAQLLARALEKEEVTAIYSSPLKRALETAHIIAEPHGLEVMVEANLREIDAGELDGLTYVEMAERYGEFLREWVKGSTTLRMPGGESMAELQGRAWGAIENIAAANRDGVVIIASHYFAIQSILCRALNISSFRRVRIDLGGMSILNFGERGISLALLNDTCHLEGLIGR